jgi:hypothetical protein
MEATLHFGQQHRFRGRSSFLLKPLAALLLILLADRLFYLPDDAGATIGVFAFALLLTLLVLHPAIWRHTSALAAAGSAGLFAFLLVEDPGILALALCWLSLSLAVLLPRSGYFGNGLRWALRLLLHTVSLPMPLAQGMRLIRRSSKRAGGGGLSSKLPVVALPVLGSLIFLLLFAAANPLIEQAVADFNPLSLLAGATFTRLFLWTFILLLVWSLLRPRLRLRDHECQGQDSIPLPGVSLASVTLSLLAFNALFALQNSLDLAFLWSGAELPAGMTLADYAHRGAYPLIVTALLAAAFVLVTLRPGSDMARSRAIRVLVYLWIGQNLFLVASTMLRTIDYVEAYSLTELRIEALIWMALVCAGLLLICVRIWSARSDTWLINANLAAAALVLSASAAADYDRVAAGWNVRHAREAGGAGAALDLCYLNIMGSSALLPLIELEGRRLRPPFRDRVTWVRNAVTDRLEAQQARWSGWTWRGARRLDAARAAIAEQHLPRFKAPPRQCDGTPFSLRAAPPADPAPATAPAATPLTAKAKR